MIAYNKSKLSGKELAVYELIEKAQGEITQSHIADALENLGIHEKHEGHLPISNKERSTLRQVRQIIHDLRHVYDAPIVSGIKGYWIPKSEVEVESYIKALEKRAQAAAWSHLRTFRKMKAVFGSRIRSEYFDKQGTLNL